MMMSMLFASELLFLDLFQLVVNVLRLGIVNKEVILEV
jgi:hypothetical protein